MTGAKGGFPNKVTSKKTLRNNVGQPWEGRREDRGREGEEMKKRGFQAFKIAYAQVRKLRNKSRRFRNQSNRSGEEKPGDVAGEEEGIKSHGALQAE